MENSLFFSTRDSEAAPLSVMKTGLAQSSLRQNITIRNGSLNILTQL